MAAEPIAEQKLVLIADDSRIQAKILEQYLLRAGYRVRTAFDGAQGLEFALQEKPHVIITDIEMPKMTGYEFCRAVKQTPHLRDVPVILLSTLSEAEDIIKGLASGADNYVTKPYDAQYLLSRVESILQTPILLEEEQLELSVTLGGRNYAVRSGRQQVLNLLVSTFENAVEKNRDLHRSNEQLTLAKEKLSAWNTQLEALNKQLEHVNQRMKHELQAAARIQRSLLPDGKFQRSDVNIAWKYLPCDELAGDFLNYFMLDDKHLAMFVVDVTGHGTASALLAVTVGRVLTAQALATSLLVRHDPFTGRLSVTPPATVVGELNRRFPMEAQGDLSFTIVYGILNLETLEFKYVLAGHPQVVHAPRNGPAVMLAGAGLGVGWFDGIEYDEFKIQLQPGDRVFLYSDGVPEAFHSNGEQFGNEQLLKIISDTANLPVADAVAGLESSVRNWCQPERPHDDVSILGCEICLKSST